MHGELLHNLIGLMSSSTGFCWNISYSFQQVSLCPDVDNSPCFNSLFRFVQTWFVLQICTLYQSTWNAGHKTSGIRYTKMVLWAQPRLEEWILFSFSLAYCILPKHKLFKYNVWYRPTLSGDMQSIFYFLLSWMELKEEKTLSHGFILFLLVFHNGSRGFLWFHLQAVFDYCSGLDKRRTLLHVIGAWKNFDNLLWLNQLPKKWLFLLGIWLVYFCNTLAHFLLLHAWVQAWSKSAELTLFSLEKRLETSKTS